MKRVLVVLLVIGCGGGVTHRIADEYTGCGGDEQYRLLEDAESMPTMDDTLAPEMTQPTNGGNVPFSPKLIVKWDQFPNNPGQPDGDVPYMDGPGCMACCPQFTIGSLTSLHLPPESGDIYDLHFTVGGSYVWRLVTTLQEWTPNDDLWAKWKGQSVSLQIYRMSILQNNPKTPAYTSTKPWTFSVGN